MKILKDGKEVKDATAIYNTFGSVDTVRIEGVHYDPKAFTFEEPRVEEKTKDSKEASKPVQKTAKKK